MKEYKLKMGRIIKLNDSCAEVIVDEGVEINLEMMNEYHHWIEEELTSPCSLLVNKLHSYSYSFEAIQRIGKLSKVVAIAVVIQNKPAGTTTSLLRKIQKKEHHTLKIFDKRENALKWLELISEKDV